MEDEEVFRALDADDAYEVVRELGRGAGGVTQLVRRAGDGGGGDREGALLVRKYIPAEVANRDVWERVREIDDACLPRVREVYELPDRLAVVCDYVAGTTVRERVRGSGPMSVGEAADVAAEVCAAAGLLHARGLVHRDISPGNVVLADDGVHLLDLGIARERTEGASRDTTRLGTWGYAAPEQFGFAQTDARSDVYSIGRLLGFMLCGVEASDDSFDAAVGELGEAERRVIGRACAFEPSARYQSADELAAALRGLCEGGGSKAGRTRARRGAWRRVVCGLLAVFGALSTLLFVWVAFRLWTRPERPTDPYSALLGIDLVVFIDVALVWLPTRFLLRPEDDATTGRTLLARQGLVLLFCLMAFAVLAVAATVEVG